MSKMSLFGQTQKHILKPKYHPRARNSETKPLRLFPALKTTCVCFFVVGGVGVGDRSTPQPDGHSSTGRANPQPKGAIPPRLPRERSFPQPDGPLHNRTGHSTTTALRLTRMSPNTRTLFVISSGIYIYIYIHIYIYTHILKYKNILFPKQSSVVGVLTVLY